MNDARNNATRINPGLGNPGLDNPSLGDNPVGRDTVGGDASRKRAVALARPIPPRSITAVAPVALVPPISMVSSSAATRAPRSGRWRGERGSLVAEYGLLMVLGATITMLATKWATGGAIWSLFGSVLSRARALVGA